VLDATFKIAERGPFYGVPLLVKDLGNAAAGLLVAAG